MFYHKYKPARDLDKFVECYFIWEGNPGTTINIESPPSALCSLVFNYADEYWISNQKYKNQAIPSCFIAGQALGNYTLHLKGSIGIAGIVFKPAAIFNFFEIPMYELTDERICFAEICPKTCKKLYAYINEATGKKEKIRILEDYMFRIVKEPTYGTTEIIESSNEIYESRGKTNIAELLDDIPMSRRSFERRFLEEVGLSPKTYSKIRRFGYTCSLMAGNREANLMDVLCEGGYYDQSHFIKDFKYFSGRTPRRYVKTNVELANYLDGIAVVEQRLQQSSS